jgi:OFA family oxalate/formate antiporter-like MFS transporter
MVLAGIFFTVCTIGSIFLKNPPADYAPVAKPKAGKSAAKSAPAKAAVSDVAPGQMLKSSRFYLIMFAFLLACLGGLVVINYSRQIAEMKGLSETATIGVLVISMFNSGGRIVWGLISDRLGRINTIIALTLGSATLTLFVPNIGSWFVYVLIAGIGFLYGGLLSSFPALTAETFGQKHVATNYGLVLLGFGAAAITASQIGGFFKDRADNCGLATANEIAVAAGDELAPYANLADAYDAGIVVVGNIDRMLPAFIIGSSCAIVAALLMIALKVINKKKGRANV